MKFLIQTVQANIKHDFSFTLIQSIDYHNWKTNSKEMSYELSNSIGMGKKEIIPIGSVEFVLEYLKELGMPEPKPKNVPEELFKFANRNISNIFTSEVVENSFVKSNDKIKSFTEIVRDPIVLDGKNYQVSGIIENIESEWRGFVYKGELIGLHNYSGDFTLFPKVSFFKEIIENYKTQPISYTIDIAIDNNNTHYLIEIHDFFSCGLYGFADLKALPFMFSRWYFDYLRLGS